MIKFYYWFISFFPDKVHDFITAYIYIRLFHGIKVKTVTPGFYIFNDGSFLYRIDFIDVCEKQGKNWIDEMEKLKKIYLND